MNLSFWAKTSGTWINAATVLAGTIAGLWLQHRLPNRMQQTITAAIGLITVWLGLTMAESLTNAQAGNIDGVILGLIALTGGGVIGEWAKIETRLAQLGEWIKRRFRGQGKFTEGFVAASLLFCIGPMALIGSINNGLTGDRTLLTIKATMDGLAAIVLTSSYGVGVGFSISSILVYQGFISLLAGELSSAISDPASDPRIALVTGVGGLMIVAIGFNLLEITKIRVGSMLPALILAPGLWQLVNW